ncbi:hypothetical protein F2Q70_00043641 [Brassica cretica]|uniref:Uncharacterized protein n=2 Tax=Brassica cretica TaxID=69181 RepID=A0A8S9KD04_BRACR|nr:hypothetical protein F2Q70_00043641 [Brassica cretica]
MDALNSFDPENSILSDSPEGSLMLSRGLSQRTESRELTPAKRTETSPMNLEEALDHNTKMTCNTRIKKENVDKRGYSRH